MENNLLETLEIIAISLAIASPGLAAFIAWIRGNFKCIKELRKDFEKFKDQYGDRQLRHSKAFIIIARRMDKINKDQHDEDTELGEEIETILKDRHGNL